jgi:hypothetical protein
MSEMIRHGVVIARDRGGIQAAFWHHHSPSSATFDRDCVAARRFKPTQPPTAALSSNAQLFRLLALLWLAGLATRLTILAIPPLIPLIRDELRMTEAQVGFLVGLPVLMFALAAVPGSLLIARLGTSLTLVGGIAITALARGSASDIGSSRQRPC